MTKDTYSNPQTDRVDVDQAKPSNNKPDTYTTGQSDRSTGHGGSKAMGTTSKRGGS